MIPKTPAYVVRRGDAFLFRRRPPVHPALSRQGLHTRPHVVVALRTRDRHEAARRAARVGVLFDAGVRMALSVEEMEALLRMAIRATASLPEGMAAPARAEAEAAIDAEARRGLAGLPNRLGDPAFLDAFGWTERPEAEEVAEQLRYSIGGHLDAYDDAIRRGSPPVPAMEALRARLDAPAPPRSAPPTPSPVLVEQEPAPAPARQRPAQRREEAAQDAPRAMPRPKAGAALGFGNPDGFQSFAGRYLDRRVAGFLCEEQEEAADPAVGERFRGASLGNYKAACRLWVDAFGNRPVKAYTHAEGREFMALLGRVPASHGKGRHVPVREAIRLADEQERRAMVEADASGASPGAIEHAKALARVPRLRTNTIKRYHSQLSQVFAWAVVSGLRPENPMNGAGMSRKAKIAKKAAEGGPARRAWTPAELRTLFAATPADPALWWAPRIAVATGARMEAILSLTGEDFLDDGAGGWMVAIRHDKSSSGDAGARDVPLHSALIEAGVLRLAEQAGPVRLFPDRERDRERGRLASHFSKDFTAHRRSLGLTARGLDFHGLRATANREMERRRPDGSEGATLTVRQAILGHASDALADSAYLRDGPDWAGRRLAVEAIPLREWGV